RGEVHNGLVAIDAASGALLDWDVGANSIVTTVQVSGDTVYVGGAFTAITTGGGAQFHRRRGLAAIDASGMPLDAWTPEIPDGVVNSLVVANGAVYVGGTFL